VNWKKEGTGETRGAAYFHKPCRTESGLYNVVKDMRDRKAYGVDKPSAAIIWVVVECQRGMGRKEMGKKRTFTSGSLFITFFILAKGRGG
jgi:hypothetical protein